MRGARVALVLTVSSGACSEKEDDPQRVDGGQSSHCRLSFYSLFLSLPFSRSIPRYRKGYDPFKGAISLKVYIESEEFLPTSVIGSLSRGLLFLENLSCSFYPRLSLSGFPSPSLFLSISFSLMQPGLYSLLLSATSWVAQKSLLVMREKDLS